MAAMRKSCSNWCRAERTLCSVSSAASLSAISSNDSDTLSLHPVVGASDGRGHPGRDEAETATGWDVTVLRAPAATAAREPVAPRLRPIWAGVEEVADPLAPYMDAPPLNGSLHYPDPELRAPAATAAREPAGPRVVHPLRAGWRWLVRLNDRIEDCWIGDLLGGVLLFLAGIGAFVAAGVLQ